MGNILQNMFNSQAQKKLSEAVVKAVFVHWIHGQLKLYGNGIECEMWLWMN